MSAAPPSKFDYANLRIERKTIGPTGEVRVVERGAFRVTAGSSSAGVWLSGGFEVR